MKCPFKMKKDIKLDMFDYHSKGHVYVAEAFAPCDGDDCPFYYQDENGVDKCSRCDGGEVKTHFDNCDMNLFDPEKEN